MSNTTGIQWTKKTWNPVVGCTKVSEGCRNCYAMRMAQRVAAAADIVVLREVCSEGWQPTDRQEAYRKVVKRDSNDRPLPQWNNKVVCIESALEEPLHWRKPTMCFVNSMSDLFHEDVPFDFIDRVFSVMALTPHITYQVLTKRPERMAEYLTSRTCQTGWTDNIEHEIEALYYNPFGLTWERVLKARDESSWPLPNVWLGASAEDQPTLDHRVPHLLRCPAAVRFLSLEPLLGCLELLLDGECSEWRCPECGSDAVDPEGGYGGEDELTSWACPDCDGVGTPGADAKWQCLIDWVIVGCESNGRQAGRFAEGYEDAARSIAKQCRDAGAAFFHKQMPIGGRVSHDPSEWPEDLRVREWPEVIRQ